MADEMLKAEAKAFVEENWEDIVKDTRSPSASGSTRTTATATLATRTCPATPSARSR